MLRKLSFVLALASISSFAQSAPRYEVAAIRPNKSEANGGSINRTGYWITFENISEEQPGLKPDPAETTIDILIVDELARIPKDN